MILANAGMEYSGDQLSRSATWSDRFHKPVRIDELGSERERPVNFSGSVNQRLREFWPEIPGCGRNLEGPFRTPKVLPRNRERRPDRGIVANPCQNWPETQNARQPISRRRALTGRWFLSVEKKRAPRPGLEIATTRLTADFRFVLFKLQTSPCFSVTRTM